MSAPGRPEGLPAGAGTAQHERFPPALAAGHFRPDELSFEQRVAMTAALARQLRFVDLDNCEAGDWAGMFESDVSLVLARIACLDLDALQQRFLGAADVAPPAALAQQVVQLAQWVDLWFKSLDGQDDGAARVFRDRVRQLVGQQLGEELRWVYARFGSQAAADGRPIAQTRARLSPIWAHDSPVLATASAGRGDRALLRERYFAFLSAIDALQRLARELLPSTLHSGTHAPAAGLLIAFLKLCETVQQEVNRFTARHLDFYLRDCLRFESADPQADEVHLACLRDARASELLRVPAGTVFDAGKDAAGQPLRFESTAPLVVTDARVSALCTLRLERDGLISPERDFGFVTRAKVERHPPMADTPSALFGGGRGRSAEDARLGLAIASPLLWLREGERRVQVVLPFEPGAAAAGAADEALERQVDAVAAARSVPALREAFGRLLGHWLLASPAELTPTQLVRLRLAAGRLLPRPLPEPVGPGDPLSLLAGTEAPERALMGEQLLQGLLALRLSAADGWLVADDAHVARAEGGGLAISLRLQADAPPIVGCDPARHGPGWGTRLPLLRIELGTRGRLYGHSLLAGLPLTEARLHVSVDGVRDVVLHNHLGRLDPTKAFHPFGPLPTLSSYLVVGSAELASKDLQRLWMQIEWAGLPAQAGGFGTHYRGYPEAQRKGDFRASLALLRDGQWQPCGGASARQPLFAGLDAGGRLRPSIAFEVDPASVRKHGRAGDPAGWGGAWPRHGLTRLQLDQPQGAFGHAIYPTVLADTVAANARTRRARRQRPLPQPPYTPLVERLRLRYEAAGVIRPEAGAQREAGAQAPGHLLHLHPFGIERLQPAAAGEAQGLLPRFDDDGQLFIGLAASAPGGVLTLLFVLRESAANPARPGAPRGRLRWATLAQDRWRELPSARVLGDSTEGFLTSGIVTLDLPGDLTADNHVMPAGCCWLRLSADQGHESFASLLGVQAHALRARRLWAPGAAAPALLPPGRITRPTASLPGLAGVQQVGASFGLRPAEDAQGLYTRAGERLRHKQRASTAWDVERLLLDRFPEVLKARCLSADEIAAAGQPRPPAGRVLVVAVPRQPRNDPASATAAPRFNAIELQRMAAHLQARASPFAQLVVRNPAYERLQLRCSVGLRPGVHEGEALQRLDRLVVALLSPWFDEGYGPDFDWVVRSEDLEARLRALEGVAFVSQLSLLHVLRNDDGVYTLADTARRGAGHARAGTPWSLVLPTAGHIVAAVPGVPDPAPQPTGIARLAIGGTFVVGREAGLESGGNGEGVA